MATDAPDPLHRMLRRETRPLHDGVEAAFARFDLGTRDGLLGFLRTQAMAVLPLEQALDDARVADLVPDWPARRRSGALLADLAALHCSTPPPVSGCDLSREGRCLGALYVLEGSRLGGKVLARQVASGDSPYRSRFLTHEAGPGAWAGFLTRLDASRCPPEDVLQGAIGVFAMFAEAATRPSS